LGVGNSNYSVISRDGRAMFYFVPIIFQYLQRGDNYMAPRPTFELRIIAFQVDGDTKLTEAADGRPCVHRLINNK